MTKKRFLNLFSFLAPLLLLLCVAIPQFPKVVAAGNANISYSLSKSPIYVGDTFDIYVNISNVTDLYGASIDFKFDPTLFSVQDVVVGNVWNGQAQLKGFLEDQRGSGYFSYYASLSGEKAGLTNSGVLFTIKAKALKSGSMPLNTTNSDVTLSVNQQNVKIKLSNSSLGNQKIQYQAAATTINIQPYITRIEENNPNISYSGTWGSESSSQFSGGTEIYAGSSASLSFTFTGTGIKLISTPYPNRGIARVTLDGTSYDVDLYGYMIYQAVVFEKTNLAYGTHSIKVEYTGRKNPNSSGTYIMIDAFDIIGGNINQLTKVNRVDDDNPNILYNGIWQKESNASFINGSESYTSSSSSLSFSFTGSGIRIITTTYFNRGIAKVTIDGNSYYVDMYRPNLGFQEVIFEKTDLAPYTTHTIKVEYTGSKSSSSSGPYIMIDGFDIINGNIINFSAVNRIEENNPNIIYNGIWESESSSSFSGGAEIYAGSTASLSFNFTGTGIRLITTPYANRGIAKVTIDGISYDVDMYSNSYSDFQKAVFEKTNLTNGTHTIKVEYTGRKNPNSSATYVMIDAFDIINGNIVNSTTVNRIEENNPNIVYSGMWQAEKENSFSGGVEYYAGSSASLSFKFTGTGIRLISTPYPNRGIAKVTIDGISYDVDMYSNNYSDFQKAVFEKTNLTNGTHTIKVEYTGRKNPNSSATYVMIDAFDIINGNIVNSTTVNRIEENNANIVYNGMWQSESSNSFSGGAQYYAATSASLSFNFTGTGIKLISTPYPNRGIARITLDGTTYDVDMYGFMYYQTVVFEKTNLTNGTHNIKVEYTGRKNPNSSGTYIMIDGFDIINGNIVNSSTVNRIEENNPNIIYNGTWKSESDIFFSGSTEYYTGSASSLSFSFTGTGIRLITTLYPNRGIAKVTIDGTSYNVDMYNDKLVYQKAVFEKTNLTNGTHTIKVEFTGNKNPNSSDAYIMIDAFDIINGNIVATSVKRIEENNNKISYSGTWKSESYAFFSGGTENYAGSSASLSFSFIGTGIKLISTPYPNRGIAKITIDGTSYDVDMYSDNYSDFQKAVFEKTDLTSGIHTIKIEYTGRKNPNSSATYIMIDAFDIINGDII